MLGLVRATPRTALIALLCSGVASCDGEHTSLVEPDTGRPLLTNRQERTGTGVTRGNREILLLRQSNGQLAITDDASRFPGSSAIDVRRILDDERSLNPELARGISSWLTSSEERIQSSAACASAKSAGVQDFVKMKPYWVGAGFLALALLVTPAIVRRFGGGEWRRVLMKGIPAVMFVTLLATFVMHLRQWQERVAPVARACDAVQNGAQNGVRGSASPHQGAR